MEEGSIEDLNKVSQEGKEVSGMSGLSIGDEVRVDREGDMNDGHQGVITDRFISDTYGNKRVVYEVEFEEVTVVDINIGHYFPDELKEE